MLCKEMVGIYCENCFNTVCVWGGRGVNVVVPKYLYGNYNTHSLFKG